jgi:hypothetical protein
MENILINLYCGQKKEVPCIEFNIYIFALILVLLFKWIWVVVTISSPSLATDTWVGRECNSKQKVGNFKRCHRTIHGTSFFGHSTVLEDNNIDSCTLLQPNNTIFQVQTLKALNTAVFCYIEMYQHFRGTYRLHHSWSYSVTSRLLPDCTVLHLRRRQCSSSQLWPYQILYTKTLIKQYDKTDPVLTWKKIDMEDIIVHLLCQIFFISIKIPVACAQTKVPNIHFGTNSTLCQQRTTQIFNHRFYQDFCLHSSCCKWIASKALFCKHMYIELLVLY